MLLALFAVISLRERCLREGMVVFYSPTNTTKKYITPLDVCPIRFAQDHTGKRKITKIKRPLAGSFLFRSPSLCPDVNWVSSLPR